MSTRPEPLRIGVVGAGYVSKYHLAALKTLASVRVVGIADPDRDTARAMAQRFGIDGVYTSLGEMAAARPQAIYILTPPSLHAKLALEALEMGCHVLVEKPMAQTTADCDRMIAKAREKGLRLSVNHSARLDPVVLKALELVRSGALGEVLSVQFLRSSDYRPYGGGPPSGIYSQGSYPFQDLGIHGLYLFEAFLGPIQKLKVEYGSYGANNPNMTFDEWRAEAICRKGTGSMYLSWNIRPMQNRLIVLGTSGVIEVDCFLQTLRVSRNLPGPKFMHMVAAAVRNGLSDVFSVTWNTVRFTTGRLKPSPGIYNGARLFARAIVEGIQPPVSAEEGRRMVALMEEVSIRADAEKDQRRRQALAPLTPARVLVTGAGGFLGRALVAKLRECGVSIRVLVRRAVPELTGDPQIQIVTGDLGDPEIVDHAVAGTQVVYHVGATMKGGKEDFESGTIWGTRNVIESCQRHGVRRLVHVSSLSVLDHAGHHSGDRVTENAPLEPYPDKRGLYTQTKLAAEQMVWEAVRTSGLPAVIVRPGQIFGPGAERVAPSGTIGLAGRWTVVGSGNALLPLVYVDDVVSALLLAAEKPGVEGHLFHLVDAELVTQRDYVEAARRYLGKGLTVFYMPSSLMMALAICVETLGRILGRGVPLNRYRVRSIRPLSVCDCRAAIEKLGWKPPVGTREGLRRTFVDRGRGATRSAAPSPQG